MIQDRELSQRIDKAMASVEPDLNADLTEEYDAAMPAGWMEWEKYDRCPTPIGTMIDRHQNELQPIDDEERQENQLKFYRYYRNAARENIEQIDATVELLRGSGGGPAAYLELIRLNLPFTRALLVTNLHFLNHQIELLKHGRGDYDRWHAERSLEFLHGDYADLDRRLQMEHIGLGMFPSPEQI